MPTTWTSARIVLLLVLAFSLAAPGPTAAATLPPAIQDSAGLFSADAVQRADHELQEISRLCHTNLRIDTFHAPSALKTWILKLKKPQDRGRFYEDWARELARKAGPDSVIILICQEPAPLQVEVAAGRHLHGKAFPIEKQSRIRECLLAGLDHGDNDQALLDAIHLVRRTLEATRHTWPEGDDAFSWAGILSVMAALVGLWACLQLVGRVRRPLEEQAPVRLLDTVYGGGGSYPAGLFATMNSSWLRELLCGLRAGHPDSPLTAECPPTAPSDASTADLHTDLLHADTQAGGPRAEEVDHLGHTAGD